MIQPCVEASVSNAADSKDTNLLPKLGVSQKSVAKLAVAGLAVTTWRRQMQVLQGKNCFLLCVYAVDALMT